MTDENANLPGFGAEQMASRASKRAERLKAEQNIGDPTDVVLKGLERAERTRRNYSQGAEGERMVAQVLGGLQRYGWVALHDVHWPGRPKANIDHIAIGPGGVVIIDAKYWTGDVVLTEAKLSQNGYARTTQVNAVATAAAAVAVLLAPEHRLATSAVLSLAAQNAEPIVLGATTVVGRAELPSYLVTMPPKFSAYDVADIARFLHGALAGPDSPNLATTALLDPKPKKHRRRRGANSPPDKAILPALPAAHKSLTPSARGRRNTDCAVVEAKRKPRRGSSRGTKRGSPQQRKSKSGSVEDLVKLVVFAGIGLWAYLQFLT